MFLPYISLVVIVIAVVVLLLMNLVSKKSRHLILWSISVLFGAAAVVLTLIAVRPCYGYSCYDRIAIIGAIPSAVIALVFFLWGFRMKKKYTNRNKFNVWG